MCQLNDMTAPCLEAARQERPTYEMIMSDPLIRLVMASDGVTVDELRQVMEAARAAICARETMPRLALVD